MVTKVQFYSAIYNDLLGSVHYNFCRNSTTLSYNDMRLSHPELSED